ncbi:hypothetical protein A2U01_0061504, partial [Trifolium medium]|nr:hypothetical protein [Trifolium medium]
TNLPSDELLNDGLSGHQPTLIIR